MILYFGHTFCFLIIVFLNTAFVKTKWTKIPVIQMVMAYLSGKPSMSKSVFLSFFSSTTLVTLAHGGAQYVFIELNWKER